MLTALYWFQSSYYIQKLQLAVLPAVLHLTKLNLIIEEADSWQIGSKPWDQRKDPHKVLLSLSSTLRATSFYWKNQIKTS